MTNYTHGNFVWRELMTGDVERAKGFYGELLGWKFETVQMSEHEYTLISVGEKRVGGMMHLPADHAAPPHWMSSVSVADVDGTVGKIKACGGSVAFGPVDIADVGRFAVVADCNQGHFSLCKWVMGDSPRVGYPIPGEFCWETLTTTNTETAFKFYADTLGWKEYAGLGQRILSVDGTEATMVADVQGANGMPSHWMPWVLVPSTIEASNERAKRMGATVHAELIEVPTIGRMSVIADPTGAAVGLFQPYMG